MSNKNKQPLTWLADEEQRKRLLREARAYREMGWSVWVTTTTGATRGGNWTERNPLHAVELKRYILHEGHSIIALDMREQGLCEIDCDDEDAEPYLQELFGGEIPPTPTWTARRGKHFLFECPDELTAYLKVGGMEVFPSNYTHLTRVPPSVREGLEEGDDPIEYTWIEGLSWDDVSPAPIPPHVVERLLQEGKQGKKEQTQRIEKTVKSGSIVSEPDRHEAMKGFFRKWRVAGMSPEVMLAAAREFNKQQCDPPVEDQEVVGLVEWAMSEKMKSPETRVHELRESLDLWKTEVGLPMATISRDGHLENVPIPEKGEGLLRQWATFEYLRQTRESLPPNLGNAFMQDCKAWATMRGPVLPRFIRVGHYDDRIYIDLTNDNWQFIEVSSEGWRVVDKPPDEIRFVRPRSAQIPLPTPVETDRTLHELLRPHVNVRDEQYVLCCSFPLSALYPWGSFPILRLGGGEDAAKSTMQHVMSDLVDPRARKSGLLAPPEAEKDLVATADNNWLLCYDNLDSVDRKLSRAFCHLATGGGFSSRMLYSNAEEFRVELLRPVTTSSVSYGRMRPELLSRCIGLNLPQLSRDKKRDEREFWETFYAARPEILGAILNAMVEGLQRLPKVRADGPEWERMADFHQWIDACELAMGFEEGEFDAAYRANQAELTKEAGESSIVAKALRAYVKDLQQGKRRELLARDLLERLEGLDSAYKQHRYWPQSPLQLSNELEQLRTTLQEEGIEIELLHNKKRKGVVGNYWCIRKTPETPNVEAMRARLKEGG